VRAAAGIAALLGSALASSTAYAAPSNDGVFFVHGTGDQTAMPSSDVNPTNGDSISNYWTLSSIQTMTTSPAGGSWKYGVATYKGASCDPSTACAFQAVAGQLYDFVVDAGVSSAVVVTHSDGANVLRYILAHKTDTTSFTTPKGRNTTLNAVTPYIKKVVFVAGDAKGTPLADKVINHGGIVSISNDILSFFGGTNYNNPAVRAQVPATMSTSNTNGVFATGATPGGVLATDVYGTNVYANIFSSDAWCGGYNMTLGLKAASTFGGFGEANDGYIGKSSATYVGYGSDSNGDARLNHNQSRRSCHGSGGRIAAAIHGALSGAFLSTPPDYTVNPSADACNATTAISFTTGLTNQYTYTTAGCTTSMLTNGVMNNDCYAAYGHDDGWAANFAGTACTSDSQCASGACDVYGSGTCIDPTQLGDWASTQYSSTSYYTATDPSKNLPKNSSTGCSDSWLGDGQCDMCLVAKYGYDGAPGQTNDDDCYKMAQLSSPPECITTSTTCNSNSNCGSHVACNSTTPCTYRANETCDLNSSSPTYDKCIGHCDLVTAQCYSSTTPNYCANGYGCAQTGGVNYGTGSCMSGTSCADILTNVTNGGTQFYGAYAAFH